MDNTGIRQDADVWGEILVQDVNKLTVVASESYARFVADLQSKIKEDLYERPMKVDEAYFAGKTITIDGNPHVISEAEAIKIRNYLVRSLYIDDDGKITDAYRDDDKNGTLKPLREDMLPLTEGVHLLVKSIFDEKAFDKMIAPKPKAPTPNKFNDARWDEFLDLWNRINKRWAYLADFKSEDLVNKAAEALNDKLVVAELHYTKIQGENDDNLEFKVTGTSTHKLPQSARVNVKYDLVQKIADGVSLSRKTVVKILSRLSTKKMTMFVNNPEEFIAKVIKEINDQKADVVIQGIKYVPSAEPEYTREIFNMSKKSEEYAKAFAAKKAIQEYIFTDGSAGESIERKFAKDLDADDSVITYAKLPKGRKGFYIPTPVGDYSPDWAILFKKGSVRYIYFVAETKGTMDRTQFRPIENAKIDCAIELFNKASTSGAKYHYVDNFKRLIEEVMATEL